MKKCLSNASRTLISKKRAARTRLRSDCDGHFGLFTGHVPVSGARIPWLTHDGRPTAADAAHTHQVVGGKAQQRLPRELGLADQLGLARPPTVLIQPKASSMRLRTF